MKRLLLFLFLGLSITALAQQTSHEAWGQRVNDEAHVLSQSTIDELEATLKAHEDSTSNQIMILILPTLDGKDLDEYALHVAHDVMKLGGEKNDNGVLLLIAIDDRKMKIEVGYGLEGVLTDALCSRIIRNEIAPAFREKRYDDGVKGAVNAIIGSIGNEYSIDVTEEGIQTELTWKEKLLIGAFIFGILGVFTFIGLFVRGCAGWFLYAFLIPFYAVFPMVILGVDGGLTALGIYAIGFPIAKLILGRTPWGKNVGDKFNGGRKGTGGSGGWSSGSGWWSSGGGGGWSSGGGGGFSGGGGSFGGGGASGSW
jgi:uncharacterized protein